MTTKILFISPQPFFQWRGSPIRVDLNILALTELGYKVDLLTLPIGADKKIDNCRVIRVINPFLIKNVPIGPSLSKVYFDALLFCQGFLLCMRNKYDVIHGVEEAGIISVILSRFFNIKIIFEKHSDPFSYKNGILKNFILFLYAKVEKITARFSDVVICTGKGLLNQVREWGYTTPTFHIFDIPSSLTEPTAVKVDQKRNEMINNPDEIVVTFVGSFAPYQGVDLMFNTIPKVVMSNPRIRFVIIGGRVQEIKEKRKMLKILRVDKSVTFLGKVAPDILPEYLYASDIFLSPRIAGVNTPLKILDYMKAGKPVLATDVPSHRLLLDEKTAVFAQPEPELLALAINNLAGDEDKRRSMGKAGRQLYETKYNFDNFRHQLSVCYKYALSG